MVRFYLTNTANTRVFNVALPGARMKLVGGDSGRVEHEEFVEEVLLAPSERVVVDVLFDAAGRADAGAPNARTGPTRWRRSRSARAGRAVARRQFEALRTNAELAAERERLAPYWTAEPDKTLAFVAEMDMGEPEATAPSSTRARCIPRSSATSRALPDCGMKLLATRRRRPTPARCTPRSSATSPAAARSAA